MKKKSLRIIGGEHRGRKIGFNATPNLRPSLDHIREMVFNWLQWDIADARVLDLFAGSGAFGIEALSRGARLASFVESNRVAADLLHQNIHALGYESRCHVYSQAFSTRLCLAEARFDLVFLDPPYQSSLLQQSCEWLVEGDYLSDGAYIYIEGPSQLDLSFIPMSWQRVKFKKVKRSLHGIWVHGAL